VKIWQNSGQFCLITGLKNISTIYEKSHTETSTFSEINRIFERIQINGLMRGPFGPNGIAGSERTLVGSLRVT
jgi:hypothetical protein